MTTAAEITRMVDSLEWDEEPPEETQEAPERFTEEQLAAEKATERAGVNQPGYKSLVAHMDRFGPDGILESAIHLPTEQYEKLEARAKRMKFDKKTKKWSS